MLVRVVRSSHIKNYASSNTATGRVSITGQIKSEDPDKERHPGPPGWGIRLTPQSHKNKIVLKKYNLNPNHTRLFRTAGKLN
jgi:hypothetical protein